MNCTEVREQLPLFIYGDLDAGAANAVQAHLATCAACQAERTAFAGVRAALAAGSPPPDVAIDTRRLYAVVLQATQRRSRRWRWAATLGVATAASLAFVLLATRAELRIDEGQLVLRWGAPPPAAAPASPPEPAGLGPNGNVEDQLVVLSRIVHVLASDSAQRDDNHQRDVVELQRRLGDLQRQMDRRFLDAEKDLRTLYKWQLVRNDKGELQ